VLACDLPLLEETTLTDLLAARDPGRAATAYASSFDGLPEPLCAIWEPASHALLSGRVGDGHICPRKALGKLDILLLPARADGALDNINTPEELAQLRGRLETTP